MNRIRNIRIYVRNKQKYNPATFSKNLQHVDIADFAGTTVGYIKEECKRNNAARIDDLYFNNEPLADDRSVAHYNLCDGTILETTSNPLWVACMNIKMVEVERDRDAHPNDKRVQNWTERSYIRKRTILSVLLNSKNEFPRQPPYLPTVESLVEYLETLQKKGAEMNPNYTQRDLQQMYEEYELIDVHQIDPIGSFLARHAARLGFDGCGVTTPAVGRKPAAKKTGSKSSNSMPAHTRKSSGTKKLAKQDVVCEDCESNSAEVYCPDCQGIEDRPGVCLCVACADKLHTGALKRNHCVRDVSAAPRAPKQYTPHPYRAPFAILIGMYSGLLDRPPVLSLSEEEIKIRGQPFTDTDLQDKQTGQYVGGFDCVENTLMKKGFVQKEAANRHTFALTESGQKLGEQLYLFHAAVASFQAANRVPDIPVQQVNTQFGTRRLYLVIDEKERDLNRLCNLAKDHGIPTLIRTLPAGDYLWILSPPLAAAHTEYNGNNRAAEVLLPFIVERKSWNDFYNSWRGTRYKRQINNMKASGVRNCFYLVEGSVKNLRFVSADQQQRLKDELESLLCEEEFYVNYTSSWSKSARWLCWMTYLIGSAYKNGAFRNFSMIFPDIQRNMTAKNHTPGKIQLKRRGQTHVWLWQDFIHAVTSDSCGEQSFMTTCEDNFGPVSSSHASSQLLLIEGLEVYNKQRSSLLNRCLESAVNLTQNKLHDAVSQQLKPETQSLIHYDVFSYWQLYIQVNYGVYVVRTETAEDTTLIQTRFSHGIEQNAPAENIQHKQHVIPDDRTPHPRHVTDVAPPTPGIIQDDYAPDSQTEEDMLQRAMAESRMELEGFHTKSLDNQPHDNSSVSVPSTSHTPVIQNIPAVGMLYPENRHVASAFPAETSEMEATSNRLVSSVRSTAIAKTLSSHVITLVDSQEDVWDAPRKNFIPVSIGACGSSMDDPVVLEDSQSQEESPGDKPSGDRCDEIPCITLIDSQEDSQLPEFDFVSRKDTHVTESKEKPSTVLVLDSEQINLESMSEEEQLKLAMRQSLCESSLAGPTDSSREVIQQVCDQNANKVRVKPTMCSPEHKSVPPKTRTKRCCQPDYGSPSIKVPKMDQKLEIENTLRENVSISSVRNESVVTRCLNTSNNLKSEPTLMDEGFARKLQEEYEESKFKTLAADTPKRTLRSKRGGNNKSELSCSETVDAAVVPCKTPRTYVQCSSESCSSVIKAEKCIALETTSAVYENELSCDVNQGPALIRKDYAGHSLIPNCDSSQTETDVAKLYCGNIDTAKDEVNLSCGDKYYSGANKQSRVRFSQTEASFQGKSVPDSHANCELKISDAKAREQSASPDVHSDLVDALPQDQSLESGTSQSILNLDNTIRDVQKEPTLHARTSCMDDISQDDTDEKVNETFCSNDSAHNFVDSSHTIDHGFSSAAHDFETPNCPYKSIKEPVAQEQKGTSNTDVKTEPLTDEEYARQLQEELNKESRNEHMPQTREPKSMRSHGTITAHEVPKTEYINEANHVQSAVSTIQTDEKLAERIHLEELLRDEQSNVGRDAELARQLQTQLSSDGPECLELDAELAKSLQEEERKKVSASDIVTNDEEIARRIHIEEQNSLGKAVSVTIEEDAELAKKIQMEESLMSKPTTSSAFGNSSEKKFSKAIPGFDVEAVNDINSPYSSTQNTQFERLPRKPIRRDRTEGKIADQLTHYREAQRQKFCNKTTTGTLSPDRHFTTSLSSTVSSPSYKTGVSTPHRQIVTPSRLPSASVSSPWQQATRTPQKPAVSTLHRQTVTPVRVPSATVSSPWQQATVSKSPPKPPIIPVGRVEPTSSGTASTFKGLGHKTVDIDERGVKLEAVKKEENVDDVIDITDSQDKKDVGDNCSPSKNIVKNVRCGNCKQLGHPRTYSQCPYFYKQSEVKRREDKAKENLKRREEKAKENEETLALLSNSERILKERKQAMLAQLKAEAEKVEEEFTDQIRQLSQVVKRREKRTNKKNK